ncbi:M48 family peptidase, partial [Candidatus Collierbacteria bacterium CG_4_9_14_3_um_filter_43_16]
YLETGISVITEKVNLYSKKIGVDYSRIDIKKVSSIWGSCSPSNRLCF